MKYYIHVHQAKIRSNIHKSPKEREPVITCKSYKSNDYYNQVVIEDLAGNEVCRVVYSPDKPLSCGARLWIELDDKNAIIGGEI